VTRALIRLTVRPFWYQVLRLAGAHQADQPPEQNTPAWARESSGWTQHTDGIPWWDGDLPAGWWSRRFHTCRPQTRGVHSWEYTEYCRCGAVRFGEVAFWCSGMAWNPNQGQPAVTDLGRWQNRNSRHAGTAMHYEGHLRPIMEGE
jgi:hypothetical protein